MRSLYYIAIALLAFVVGCTSSSDVDVVEPNLEVDIERVDIDYTAQRVSIPVQSNVEVEAECVATWISVVSTDGGVVELAVEANGDSDDRVAQLLITAEGLSHRVTIKQTGMPEMIALKLCHSMSYLLSPQWYGSSLRGTVDWGDGLSEDYAEGLEHDYRAADNYEAMFLVEGADGFKIDKLGEIDHLEITF